MKKVLLGLLVAISLSFTSSVNIDINKFKSIKKSLSKTVSVKHDKFEKLMWINSKKPTRSIYAGSTTIIESYFMFKQDETIGKKRFRLKHTASKWLFIESITFLVGKGNTEQRNYKLNLSDSDVDREVLSGGTVYEKVDIPFNSTIESFFNDVLNTEKNEPVAIKITGKSKYRTTATWTGKLKKMANPVFDAHDYLTQKKYK